MTTYITNEELVSEFQRISAEIPIADLRKILNERCVREKTLGWTYKGINISEPDFALGCTTDDDVATDKDVISYIQAEMFNDDENDSIKLLDLYRNANEIERAIMDSVLVCICGWTMSHIVEESADWDDDDY